MDHHQYANLFAVRYEFLVAVPHAQNATMRLEVGWNSVGPNGKGGFKPAQEMAAFYIDAHYPEGEYSRKTFGLYPSGLSYEAVKQKLMDIVNYKAPMVSGQKRHATEPSNKSNRKELLPRPVVVPEVFCRWPKKMTKMGDLNCNAPQ